MWVSFAPASAAQKGTATSGFQYGLEVAIVCDQGGALYALSNKMPPFGQVRRRPPPARRPQPGVAGLSAPARRRRRRAAARRRRSPRRSPRRSAGRPLRRLRPPHRLTRRSPAPPQPTTFAEIGKGVITDPVTKTVFSLRDGKPQGKWCPSPPGIGPILFNLITSPTSIPTFPVRKQGGSLQALVNVNAKAQFESNYWRGVLDAQGKVDGGYY